MADPRDKPPSDDRAAILARRRYFVASALAGIAVAACDATNTPQPCLNMTATPLPDAAPVPQPCLSPVVPRDAEAAPPEDAAAPVAAPPMPCLEVSAPPKR